MRSAWNMCTKGSFGVGGSDKGKMCALDASIEWNPANFRKCPCLPAATCAAANVDKTDEEEDGLDYTKPI